MKKNKITHEESLYFLDTVRKLKIEKDEPTVAISIRIPKNMLNALKVKAKIEGKKYQSMIVEYLRQGLREK